MGDVDGEEFKYLICSVIDVYSVTFLCMISLTSVSKGYEWVSVIPSVGGGVISLIEFCAKCGLQGDKWDQVLRLGIVLSFISSSIFSLLPRWHDVPESYNQISCLNGLTFFLVKFLKSKGAFERLKDFCST